MSKTRVEFHAGNLTEALKSPKLATMLKGKAEQVAAVARANAPYDESNTTKPHYRDNIEVEVVEHPTRVVAQVHAKVPHAWVVEANTGNLAKALGSA